MRDLAQVEYAEWAASQGASLVAIEFLTGSLIEQGWSAAQVKALFEKDEPQPQPPAVLAWPPNTMPLKWSVDFTNAPTNLRPNQMLNAMRRVFKEYQDAPGSLSFIETSGAADLEIRFGKVDGAGGTLAFVYQPASGFKMNVCGGQCGDYMFDSEENFSIVDFENVFRHETGHAIGAGHFTSGIMAPTYSFGTPRTKLDPLILSHIASGYPEAGIA